MFSVLVHLSLREDDLLWSYFVIWLCAAFLFYIFVFKSVHLLVLVVVGVKSFFPVCLPSWPCLINCFSSAWTILYFWCKLYCCFKNVVLFLSWWYIMIINYYFVYGHNVIIIVWFHTASISFLFFNETRKQNVYEYIMVTTNFIFGHFQNFSLNIILRWFLL